MNRVSWPKYFMSIAEAVSKRSPCLRRAVGAVLVRSNQVLATGYNGPPRGIPHCTPPEEGSLNLYMECPHCRGKSYERAEDTTVRLIMPEGNASVTNDVLTNTVDVSSVKCPVCKGEGVLARSYTTCKRMLNNIPSGERLDLCLAIHGEQNVIIQAARHGISVLGATMYCTVGPPCLMCTKMIINAGISEMIYSGDYPDKQSQDLLNIAGVKLTKYA
jgi:deoxycytidylate deaminase